MKRNIGIRTLPAPQPKLVQFSAMDLHGRPQVLNITANPDMKIEQSARDILDGAMEFAERTGWAIDWRSVRIRTPEAA